MTVRTTQRAVASVAAAVLLASLTTGATAVPALAAPTCAGKAATIVGTARSEIILGTPRADVIVSRGGDDVIRGGGGDDVICGGDGHDRLVGVGGRDLLLGGAGPDVLLGGDGWDRLRGEGGNDRLDGGAGIDTCSQGPGTGTKVRCELPPPVLAIAYSDRDGNHAVSRGDVKIAELLDTNLDGAPSPGDAIRMGRYPRDFAATTFGDWIVTSHAVAIVEVHPSSVIAWTAGRDQFAWAKQPEFESYVEGESVVQDSFDGGSDQIDIEYASPSVGSHDFEIYRSNDTDDRFIDVEIHDVAP